MPPRHLSMRAQEREGRAPRLLQRQRRHRWKPPPRLPQRRSPRHQRRTPTAARQLPVLLRQVPLTAAPVRREQHRRPTLPRAKSESLRKLLQPRGKITVEDTGSLNGTYVNRQPRLIPGTPVDLKNGDEIIIGKTFLRLVIEPIS